MVVTISLGGFVADQMRYNLVSAQYWRNWKKKLKKYSQKNVRCVWVCRLYLHIIFLWLYNVIVGMFVYDDTCAMPQIWGYLWDIMSHDV